MNNLIILLAVLCTQNFQDEPIKLVINLPNRLTIESFDSTHLSITCINNTSDTIMLGNPKYWVYSVPVITNNNMELPLNKINPGSITIHSSQMKENEKGEPFYKCKKADSNLKLITLLPQEEITLLYEFPFSYFLNSIVEGNNYGLKLIYCSYFYKGGMAPILFEIESNQIMFEVYR